MKVKFEITHLYDENCYLYPLDKKIVVNVEMSADDFFRVALKSQQYETRKYRIEVFDSCCKKGIRTFENCRAWPQTEDYKKEFDELQAWYKEQQELNELYSPTEDEPWWNR